MNKIKITEQQSNELSKELAEITEYYSKQDGVECIYFTPLTDYAENYDTPVILVSFVSEYQKYSDLWNEIERNQKKKKCLNEKYKDSDIIERLGVIIQFTSTFNREYSTMPLNPSEMSHAQDLFNARILFDKTGEYTEIKEKAHEHFDKKEYTFSNIAEIEPPIQLKKVSEKK